MKTSERRKNKRQQVKKGIAGLLTPDIPQVGKILDISAGGLSFVCRECDLPINSPVEMDILIMDKDLFFPNVSCIIVAKSVYDEVNNCGPMAMKRCGVKFNPLKAHQRLKLNSLILPEFSLQIHPFQS
ncbi:MAG: PilZ domain-containing protein [Desulfobulbaceae bacterium]|nr:PilZ domain-containing protein [Desulfobulbaceae bacterium]